MIDWRWVGSNTLWILGLAVCLAALSFRAYRASQRDARDTSEPEESDIPNPRSAIRDSSSVQIGLVLVSLGLCAAGGSRLERALWALLAALIVLLSLVSRYSASESGDEWADDA